MDPKEIKATLETIKQNLSKAASAEEIKQLKEELARLSKQLQDMQSDNEVGKLKEETAKLSKQVFELQQKKTVPLQSSGRTITQQEAGTPLVRNKKTAMKRSDARPLACRPMPPVIITASSSLRFV